MVNFTISNQKLKNSNYKKITTILKYVLLLHDHLIKGSFYFTGGFCLSSIITLPNLMAKSYAEMDNLNINTWLGGRWLHRCAPQSKLPHRSPYVSFCLKYIIDLWGPVLPCTVCHSSNPPYFLKEGSSF